VTFRHDPSFLRLVPVPPGDLPIRQGGCPIPDPAMTADRGSLPETCWTSGCPAGSAGHPI